MTHSLLVCDCAPWLEMSCIPLKVQVNQSLGHGLNKCGCSFDNSLWLSDCHGWYSLWTCHLLIDTDRQWKLRSVYQCQRSAKCECILRNCPTSLSYTPTRIKYYCIVWLLNIRQVRISMATPFSFPCYMWASLFCPQLIPPSFPIVDLDHTADVQ